MSRYLLLGGILILIVAGLWRFVLAPQSFERFPAGWSWKVDSLGLTSYADETTGQFPEGTSLKDDPVNITVRTVTTDTEGLPSGQVRVTDHYQTRNAVTNAIDWEFTSTTINDVQTGKHIEGDLAGDYYFIPSQPDPSETYVISNSVYHSLPVSFQTEETVAGIRTYKYAYYGDLPNTLAYSQIEFESNQEVICFDFELEYWVEPLTGEIVKFREWCEGDWVVDKNTNENLYAISRWGAENTGDDLIRRSGEVNALVNNYNMNRVYIPAGLALFGVLFLGAGFVSSRSKKNSTQVAA